MTGHRSQAHIALMVATLIFGLNYAIAKSIVPQPANPMQLVFLRLAGSLLLLAVYFFRNALQKIDRRHWLRFFAAGLTGVAINQVFFFEGIARTSPLESSIIHTASPVMVVLFAGLALRERSSLLNWLGIAMGALGAVYLIVSRIDGHQVSHHVLGNIFIVVNMTAYSAYMVIVKPLMKHYSAATVMFYVFLTGFVLLLPFSARQVIMVDFKVFTVENWVSLFYVMIMSTLLGFTLTVFALKHLKAGTASYYMYFQPVIAGIGGFVAGFQPLTWDMGLAAALIFGGVYFVTYSRRAPDAAKADV